MTSDYRITPGLIHDITNALESHGYYRSDDQHADRAITLIGDLARIYEGTQDYPASAYLITVPSSQPSSPGPSVQAGRDAVILADGDVSTVLAALEIAADCKRDRAETCADCADRSCLTCQSRLRDAQAYDHLTAQIHQAADARTVHCDQPEPDSRTFSQRQADPAVGLEAGQ